MNNSNRSYLFKKSTAITLSPMSTTFNSSECYEPRIPCTIETRKNKGKNTNASDDRTSWRKFAISRCRFDQFSRMDSATSSISNENNYVSPCNEEARISLNFKTPALMKDEGTTSERRNRGIYQDTSTKTHFQSKKDYRDATTKALDAQYSRSRIIKDTDRNIVFAQLQIKGGKATVIYKKNRDKSHKTTQNRNNCLAIQESHVAEESNSQEASSSPRKSSSPWNSLASKAA